MSAPADLSRIFDRVIKLRALGESDNVNESAAALAEAARLMENHSIEEAALVSDAPPADFVTDTDGPEPRGIYSGERIAVWRSILARECARVAGCFSYRSKRQGITALGAIGTRGDIARYHALYSLCENEVQFLTARHASGKGARFARAFRLGCVKAIIDAIEIERRRLREELRGRVSESSLVVVDTKSQRAQEALGPIERGPTSGRSAIDRAGFFLGVSKGQAIYPGASRRRISGGVEP